MIDLIDLPPNNTEDSLGVLKREAEGVNFILGDDHLKSFALYLEELNCWNKKINLVGRRNNKDIVIKDFLDSLFISKYLPSGSAVIDIGSGAGIPGIPIKIYRKDLTVGLLEIREKKVSFLKHVIRQLNMENIIVVRPEEEKFKNRYDFSVSRAFGSMAKIVETSNPYLKEDGIVLAMKGKTGGEELEREIPHLRKMGWRVFLNDKMRLPVVGHERIILGLKKSVSRETFL